MGGGGGDKGARNQSLNAPPRGMTEYTRSSSAAVDNSVQQ